MARRGCFFCAGLAVFSLAATANMAMGAGFALYEGSARGNALGGSLVARADDPSALFYNPAGITQLPEMQVMAGATTIGPGTHVVTTRGGTETRSETKAHLWLSPHLYSTYQCTNAIWFGLGVFSRFGLGTEFDDTWPGRYNSYNAVIQTLTVNPNVAFKVSDKLSLAAGASWMWLDLTLEQKIDFGGMVGNSNALDVDQSLTGEGDDSGYGFNLALHYRACDWMSLGISYVSQVRQKIKGDADFSKPSGISAGLFQDTKASGKIRLPDMVFLGLAFYPTRRLSLEIDGVWTGWSTYDQFTVDYRDPILPGLDSVTQDKHWNDVWRLQLGTEYQVSDWLDLRLGYVRDNSPIPEETADYLVPSNDRHVYTMGCGLHRGRWTGDLSYSYVDSANRSVAARPEDGILEARFEDGYAHMFGFSVSRRL
jgi:long-chain fatty acid transport protein